jgi:hypothetical protein
VFLRDLLQLVGRNSSEVRDDGFITEQTDVASERGRILLWRVRTMCVHVDRTREVANGTHSWGAEADYEGFF